jgi:hypothetical protein
MLRRPEPVDPPRTACDTCKLTPSDWFIYLITEPESTYTLHSQQCESCTKQLILTLVERSLIERSNGKILISHWKPRLEIYLP